MTNFKLKPIKQVDPNHLDRMENIGYGFHSEDGVPYWTEDRYFEITNKFADRLAIATDSVWELCLQAVDYVIDNKLFSKFNIPKYMEQHIIDSWENETPSIYGRFDFGYDPKTDKLKMLEFNADTPTSLYETGVVQWDWKNHYFGEQTDQYSSVHETLIDWWREVKPYLKGELLHFACVNDSLEDITNVEYIRDCAMQAGIETRLLAIDDIGWDSERHCFVGLDEEVITDIFKLYPWEWMVHEEFGKKVVEDYAKAQWIEPSWKMILSNKAILPILHELFPNHENILECYFDSPRDMKDYVKKPLLSREGANVSIIKDGKTVEETTGDYGEEGFIYQEYIELNTSEFGSYIIGSWVIGEQACGISFRESSGLITNNVSRYIPHIINDNL